MSAQFQGYNLTETTEALQGNSHNWSAAVDGYWLFRKARPGRSRSCPLCVREV